jgi:hypothetical protein
MALIVCAAITCGGVPTLALAATFASELLFGIAVWVIFAAGAVMLGLLIAMLVEDRRRAKEDGE